MSQLCQTLYVVICHDRHTDDQVTVHASRQGADARIAEFQALYDDSHEWAEQSYGRDRGWVRYVNNVDTHDDGPTARIEERKLLP